MLSLFVMGMMTREISASDLRSLTGGPCNDTDGEVVVCNATGLLGVGGRPAGHLERLFDSGIDVVTVGAKALARPASRQVLAMGGSVVRPLNVPSGAPGRSALKLETPSGACWVVSLDTGDDRLPVDPPWESFLTFERSVTDRLPVLIDCFGSDLEMKQALAWRAASLSRPVHLVGTGLGCIAGHPVLKNGRACVPDVGVAAEESAIGGVAPDVWWQIREHRKGASAMPPERVMIDAMRLRLDDAGRAISVERLRCKVNPG